MHFIGSVLLESTWLYILYENWCNFVHMKRTQVLQPHLIEQHLHDKLTHEMPTCTHLERETCAADLIPFTPARYFGFIMIYRAASKEFGDFQLLCILLVGAPCKLAPFAIFHMAISTYINAEWMLYSKSTVSKTGWQHVAMPKRSGMARMIYPKAQMFFGNEWNQTRSNNEYNSHTHT